MDRLPTTIADDTYELQKLIGQGAMGAVYLGLQKSLGRAVAIKLINLNEQLSENEKNNLRLRLADEASAAARVIHPNIVNVYDAGLDEKYGPYVVFEYVEGTTLRDILAEQGKLPWSEVRNGLAKDLLSALEVVHRAGVVHRDIKPENILLDRENRWRLADFGLAVFPQRQAKTEEGVCVGTPGYLAPERLSSDRSDTDQAADIYSVALVIAEATIGFLPFFKSAEQAQKHHGPRLIKAQLKAIVTPALLNACGIELIAAQWLAKALARNPENRPRASELVQVFTDDGVQNETLLLEPAALTTELPKLQKSRWMGLVFLLIFLLFVVASWFRLRPTEGVALNGRASLENAELDPILGVKNKLVSAKTLQRLLQVFTQKSEKNKDGKEWLRRVGRKLGTKSVLYVVAEDALAGRDKSNNSLRGERLEKALRKYLRYCLVHRDKVKADHLAMAAYLTSRITSLSLDKSKGERGFARVLPLAKDGFHLLFVIGKKERESLWARTYAAILEALLLSYDCGLENGKLSSFWSKYALALFRARRHEKLGHSFGSILFPLINRVEVRVWDQCRPKSKEEALQYLRQLREQIEPIPRGVGRQKKRVEELRRQVLFAASFGEKKREIELDKVRRAYHQIRGFWWEYTVLAMHGLSSTEEEGFRDRIKAHRLMECLLKMWHDDENTRILQDFWQGAANEEVISKRFLIFFGDLVEAKRDKSRQIDYELSYLVDSCIRIYKTKGYDFMMEYLAPLLVLLDKHDNEIISKYLHLNVLAFTKGTDKKSLQDAFVLYDELFKPYLGASPTDSKVILYDLLMLTRSMRLIRRHVEQQKDLKNNGGVLNRLASLKKLLRKYDKGEENGNNPFYSALCECNAFQTLLDAK